jgi:hypothetical protein
MARRSAPGRGDGAERLRHRACLNHGEHRQAKQPGHIGAAGRAVVQAHDAFDQNQVCLARRQASLARVGSPVIQRSIDCTGAPLAAASKVGSRKSGRS